MGKDRRGMGCCKLDMIVWVLGIWRECVRGLEGNLLVGYGARREI